MRLIYAAAALGALGLAAPSYAQDKAVIADCSHGNGATFVLAQVTDEEMRIVMPELPPRPFPDAILVLEPKKAPYWDTRTQSEIDLACGGDGQTELELFATLQPKSGLWQARIGAVDIRGCPAIMEEVFPISPGALSGQTNAPRRITFDIPFHPDNLDLTENFEAQGGGAVNWVEISENSWKAEIFPEYFGELPPGMNGESKLTWTLTLKSETEIEHLSVVTIAFPAELVAVLGGDGDCQALTQGTWTRVGD